MCSRVVSQTTTSTTSTGQRTTFQTVSSVEVPGSSFSKPSSGPTTICSSTIVMISSVASAEQQADEAALDAVAGAGLAVDQRQAAAQPGEALRHAPAADSRPMMASRRATAG